MKQKQQLVRFISGFTGIAMTIGIMLGGTGFSVSAATGSALDIGSPTFKNTDTLTGYNHGVEYTAGNMLKSIYDSDMSKGGDSFYMDRILGRDGVADGDPNKNGNDDGDTFLTRGRALYMYTSNPSVIGFGGNTAYHQQLGKNMYAITFQNGGSTLNPEEITASRSNTPSYWTSAYNLDENIIARVNKFISYENIAVTLVTLQNTSDTEKTLTMNVNSGFVKEKSTVKVNGADQNELIGTLSSPSNLTTITARLTGDSLNYSDTSASTLTGDVTIPAKGTKDVKVAMTFSTTELPNSYTDYIRFAGYDNSTALKTQKQEYNKWWDENIPYIDVPNKAIQKAIDYRWWLERFNVLDANIPGYDYQYPVTIEGVLGYNNAIALTQPMHLQDTKWMRSAYLPYGQLLSVGNSSQSSAFLDNPGNRGNWNNHYGQYIATAGLEAFNVIGGNADIANTFAYYFEHDAKGQLEHYGNHSSSSTPESNLIAYNSVYMTGNDADTISMHYPGVGTYKMHGENAYVYGAANAAGKLYQVAGNTAKATELTTLASDIQSDILEYLWCNKDSAFETRAVQPTSAFAVHNPDQPNLVKLTESNNFNYFSEYAVPTDAASVAKYGKALEKLKYADEFPIFPYYTADQVDNKLQPGGSNNFSNINFTVQARAYEAALRAYDPTHQYVTPKMLSTMVEWCAWNMYPDSGDVRYPNNNEFFNADSAANKDGNYPYYRSWIYHNILGNYNYIFVEDMAGLRPRSDNKIELSPIDFEYDHFMVDNLRYHGKDVTIVWDKIDGKKNYSNLPEGYSLYIDNKLVLNLDNLATVVYDPDTGEISFPDQAAKANVLSKAASSVPDALNVDLTETRVVDMFKKSGIDLTISSPNLAAGAKVTASYTPSAARAASWAEKHRADGNDPTSKAVNETVPDPNAVIDGVTVDMPFWGNDKSTNNADYLELDLGSSKTIDMLNIFFYNDRQSGGYTEPAKYNIQYWDGAKWVHAQNQTRTPGIATANYNNNRFTAFTTNKVRLTFYNKQDHYTAVTEVQLFNEGGVRPIVKNIAPVVSLKVDESKNENLKAYLIATCSDDGMPYDSNLSYTWEVIEKPEGAKAFFSDTSSLKPAIAVSVPGQYKIQFTANDGEKTTTATTIANITESAAVADKDVAPLATASSDYTAGWENVTKVNDTSNEPSKSAPDSTGKGWGNWGCAGGAGSTHYLQYTWTEPVSIYKNDIYWYDDRGGTLIPESISFQYLDSNDTWQDVKMITDFADAKARNQYNTIEIAPITTKSIRMNCVLSADGTGVLRWKTYATPIDELLPVYAAAKKGTVPSLPEYIYATMKDGSLTKAPVVWDTIPESKVAGDGVFTVTGVNMDTGKFTTAEVTVRSDMDMATITDVYDTQVTAISGKKAVLPSTVKVKYNNGAVDNISVPVEWDDTVIASASAIGVHNLIGIGTVQGTTTKANLILTVKEATKTVSKAALKTQIDSGKKLIQSSYTEESWSQFSKALGDAGIVYDNAAATQEMVDTALANLKDAAGKLEFKPSDKVPEMILHLNMNGDISDASKNAFSGSLTTTDSAVWVDGINGKALNFTGEDTSLDIPAGNNLLTPDITISYWIKRTGTLTGDNVLLWSKKDKSYNGNGFYTSYPAGDKFSSFFVVDDFNAFYVDEDPNVFLPENKWTHIAVAWNSTTKRAAIYKNGVSQTLTQIGTPDKISAPTDGTAVNRFGKGGYGGQFPVGMQIDDFRIYDADMSASAISGLYNEYSALAGSNYGLEFIKRYLASNEAGALGEALVRQVAQPTAKFSAGAGDGQKILTLTASSEKETIYYTDDGSEPTVASKVYNGPITIDSSKVIKAFSVKDGMRYSDTAICKYTAVPDPDPDQGNGYIPPKDSANTTTTAPVTDTTPAVTVTTAADGSAVIKNTPKLENGAVVSEVTSEDIDKALLKAVSNSGMKTLVVELKDLNGTKKFIQRLPADKLSAIAATACVQVKTPVASVTVPSNMLKQNEAEKSKTLEIVVEASDSTKLKGDAKERLAGKPAINIYTVIDGKKVEWSNLSAPIKVEMDYSPTAEELKNTDRIVAYTIDSSNKLIAIPNSRYDKATGKVSFTTTHIGNYAIAYAEDSFSDSAKYSWAQKEIDALTVKGVAEGRTATEFLPGDNVNRGEYLSWLVRALGLSAEVTDNFDDIVGSKYSQEIGIAKALGITSGTGDNKFQPDQSITRQDLMTLTVKALDVAKRISSKGTQDDIRKFNDASGVSGYAVESVATLVKNGVIVGSGNRLNPKGDTTRAEAAVIIYKIYNK